MYVAEAVELPAPPSEVLWTRTDGDSAVVKLDLEGAEALASTEYLETETATLVIDGQTST